MYISKQTDVQWLEGIIRTAMQDSLDAENKLESLWSSQGHVDMHFGENTDFLIGRLLEGNKEFVTCFKSQEVGEKAILQTIKARAGKIAEGFCSGARDVTVPARFDTDSLGSGLTKDYHPVSTRSITVNLHKDHAGIAACGFILNTAYPNSRDEKGVTISEEQLNIQDIINNNGHNLAPEQRLAVACRELVKHIPGANAYCRQNDKHKTFSTKVRFNEGKIDEFEINMTDKLFGGRYLGEESKHSKRTLDNFLRDNEELRNVVDEIDVLRNLIHKDRFVNLYLAIQTAFPPDDGRGFPPPPNIGGNDKNRDDNKDNR